MTRPKRDNGVILRLRKRERKDNRVWQRLKGMDRSSIDSMVEVIRIASELVSLRISNKPEDKKRRSELMKKFNRCVSIVSCDGIRRVYLFPRSEGNRVQYRRLGIDQYVRDGWYGSNAIDCLFEWSRYVSSIDADKRIERRYQDTVIEGHIADLHRSQQLRIWLHSAKVSDDLKEGARIRFDAGVELRQIVRDMHPARTSWAAARARSTACERHNGQKGDNMDDRIDVNKFPSDFGKIENNFDENGNEISKNGVEKFAGIAERLEALIEVRGGWSGRVTIGKRIEMFERLVGEWGVGGRRELEIELVKRKRFMNWDREVGSVDEVREMIEKWYVRERGSMNEVASKIGVSSRALREKMWFLGIDVREVTRERERREEIDRVVGRVMVVDGWEMMRDEEVGRIVGCKGKVVGEVRGMVERGELRLGEDGRWERVREVRVRDWVEGDGEEVIGGRVLGCEKVMGELMDEEEIYGDGWDGIGRRNVIDGRVVRKPLEEVFVVSGGGKRGDERVGEGGGWEDEWKRDRGRGGGGNLDDFEDEWEGWEDEGSEGETK